MQAQLVTLMNDAQIALLRATTLVIQSRSLADALRQTALQIGSSAVRKEPRGFARLAAASALDGSSFGIQIRALPDGFTLRVIGDDQSLRHVPNTGQAKLTAALVAVLDMYAGKSEAIAS